MATVTHEPGSSSGLSLAVRLRGGSSDAWRELVDLYGPLIDSWCQRAGLAADSRADVGQDVFIAVYRHIGSFDATRPGATFRGWLWTITRNAALARLRKNTTAGEGGSEALARLGEIPDPWDSVSLDAAPSSADDTAQLLSRALEQIRPQMEERTWEAFWRTAVLQRSAVEVAEELDMTPMAVRQAKSRMLRRLRRQLGEG